MSEVKITQQQLLEAVHKSPISFKLKLLYDIIDDLPLDYYKQVVSEEFYENLCQTEFWEVYDAVSKGREFFNSRPALIFALSKLGFPPNGRGVNNYILNGKLAKGRYLIRHFASAHDYERPDIIFGNTTSVPDGGSN